MNTSLISEENRGRYFKNGNSCLSLITHFSSEKCFPLINSHFSPLNSHFSLLISHFPCPTSHLKQKQYLFVPISNSQVPTSHLEMEMGNGKWEAGNGKKEMGYGSLDLDILEQTSSIQSMSVVISDIAGLCKNVALPVSHFQAGLSWPLSACAAAARRWVYSQNLPSGEIFNSQQWCIICKI